MIDKALAAAATYARTDRHRTAWAHLDRAERLIEEGRRDVVAGMRQDGRSWDEIASALRLSKATLHRRYRLVDDDLEPAPEPPVVVVPSQRRRPSSTDEDFAAAPVAGPSAMESHLRGLGLIRPT